MILPVEPVYSIYHRYWNLSSIIHAQYHSLNKEIQDPSLIELI